MKRVLITVLALALGAGLVGAFAEGQSEDPDSFKGRGGRYNGRPELEEVTLTGEVYFEGLDFPVLRTDDGEYNLMIPRFYTYEVDIEEGTTITVEGYLGPEDGTGGRFARSNDGEPHVMVTKALVGDDEYDLSRGSMMDGGEDWRRRGGPMGRAPRRAPQDWGQQKTPRGGSW